MTEKAEARLGLGVESTVVALVGPTGAGKSLLFNTLSGTELAAVGRRRPTTSTGQAAVWGDGADALLDWLEIKRRHRLDEDGLSGLVLLDLPDFDSVEAAHRLEVDRIVELADLLVWVVEPQKYADAALHDGYLRPLSAHDESMAVVLNQADLLAPEEIAALRRDTARLLTEDGLDESPVLVVSARTGAGVDELRELLARRVASRKAAVERLSADAAAAAASLRRWCSSSGRTRVERTDREVLVTALAEAAGVPRVVEAVGEAHRHRGALASGWPLARWVRRLKPDPLRRLRLGDGAAGVGRTSLPPASDVQLAQVATAVRQVADSASAGLPAPWPTLVRRAASAGDARVVDRLDQAVGSAKLDTRAPRWWRAASLLQWLLVAAAVVGTLWITLAGVAGYLRIEDVVPLPELGGAPIATWLVLGGLVLGVVLSFVTRARQRRGRAPPAAGGGARAAPGDRGGRRRPRPRSRRARARGARDPAPVARGRPGRARVAASGMTPW